MARVNIDDDLESQSEFWRLLPLVGNDRDIALGKLVRFLRLAQYAFGRGQGLGREALENDGLGSMIGSGWATPFAAGGYQVKDAEERFAWYAQKVAAAKNGGRPRKPDPDKTPPQEACVNRESDSANRKPDSGLRNIDSANRNEPDDIPPVPVPVLAPVQKQISHTHAREAPPDDGFDQDRSQKDFEACEKVWLETVRSLGTERNFLRPGEDMEISRLISKFGAAQTKKALEGMRYDKRGKSFDPARFISMKRIWENFSRFADMADNPALREGRDNQGEADNSSAVKAFLDSPEGDKLKAAAAKIILPLAGVTLAPELSEVRHA